MVAKSVEQRVGAMVRALQIFPDRCTGCMQCELGCSWAKTETFRPSASLIRVPIFDEEASYAPYTCVQCAEAWCMTVCPTSAITVDRQTGAKVVLESRCIGCHLCTLACPFGTVFTEPGSGLATKCDLCGGRPACVAACPTAAITFEEAESPGGWFGPWGREVARRHAEAVS